MNANKRKENKNNGWLGIAIFLLFTQPMLAIPLGIFGGIIWLVIKAMSNQQSTPAKKQPGVERFDDCPQPIFCFHKDKGEHHVRKGKEIDPWDRPDIDISKYQRSR